jgi:hypothetical protein
MMNLTEVGNIDVQFRTVAVGDKQKVQTTPNSSHKMIIRSFNACAMPHQR